MSKNKVVLTEQFKQECRVINLHYEYPGWTGKENFGIITELSEDELEIKYGDSLSEYRPCIVLPESFNLIRQNYVNNEAKHRMRSVRFGHAFDITDGEFEQHHPEVSIRDELYEEFEKQNTYQELRNAVNMLPELQKKRVIQYYYEGKTMREIATLDGVNVSAVSKSLDLSVKKLRIFLDLGEQTPSPSSNK